MKVGLPLGVAFFNDVVRLKSCVTVDILGLCVTVDGESKPIIFSRSFLRGWLKI